MRAEKNEEIAGGPLEIAPSAWTSFRRPRRGEKIIEAGCSRMFSAGSPEDRMPAGRCPGADRIVEFHRGPFSDEER